VTPAPAGSLQIVRASTMADLRPIAEVVEAVTGYLDIHPGVMLTVLSTGGYASAAYEDGRCIGGCYALVGLRDGRPYLHSEMLAVLPERQGAGVAQRLKLDQREFAREQGIDLVTWTVDPLRGRNATLNLRRLGCTVAGYCPDMYGELPGFSAGWPTDQLMLEWWVGSAHVQRVLAREDLDAAYADAALPRILDVRARADGLPEPVAVDEQLAAPRVLLEIPLDAQDMRGRDMDLVLRWRFAVRTAFLSFLGRGYRVEWFLARHGPERRNFYVLAHPDVSRES
jgi:predicted GNAT superfamily acetyltransferase